jgi:hypothetical protein
MAAPAGEEDLIFRDGFDPPPVVVCGWDTAPGNPGALDGVDPGSVSALEMWRDELYVGVNAFDTYNGIPGGFARLDPETLATSPLGDAAEIDGFTNDFIAFDPGDGERLYILGAFNGVEVGGTELPGSRGVVSWDGTSVAAVPGSPLVPLDFLWTGALFDGRLALAGSRGAVDPPQKPLLALWDGTDWEVYSDEFSGTVAPVILASTVFQGDLYIGGRFSSVDTGGGPVISTNVMGFDGTSFFSVGGGVERGTSIVSQVLALTVFDDGSGDALYIGGRFDQSADGNAIPLFAVAKWDGAALSAVGAGFPMPSEVRGLEVYDDGNGPALYATGNFTADTGGTPVARFARWTGTEWVQVGGGVGENPGAMAVLPNQQLAIGGSYTSVGDGVVPGSGAANGLAWWGGDCGD